MVEIIDSRLASKPLPVFMGLPTEIHLQIFNQHLLNIRIEHMRDHLAIIRVCKSIYNRLISTVRDEWVRLICPSTSRSLFRDPLANGLPSLFQSESPLSRCPIHTGISELEFVKLRRAHIVVRYRSDAEGVTTLTKNLHRVTVALKKSHSLREVILEIGPQFVEGFIDDNDELKVIKPLENDVRVWELRDGLQSLVKACLRAKITVTVKSSDSFENTDRRLTDFRTLPFENFPDCFVQLLRACMPRQPCCNLIAADESESASSAHFHQPECPKCYAVFGSRRALLRHIKKMPRHDIEFRVKKRNDICATAMPGGGRHTCLVCAMPFDARASLDRHLKKAHGRPRTLDEGIAPRWKEDNRRSFPVEQRGPAHEMRWINRERVEFEVTDLTPADLTPFDSASEEEYPPGFW
jgi:uncharacterized C2H2 Zn-finger protein